MTDAETIARSAAPSARLGRWWQLSLGVICMSMIANLQYGWTLFVNPIHDKQRLEPLRHPGGLHGLRPRRDLARAARGIPRRPHRPQVRRASSLGSRRRSRGSINSVATTLPHALPRRRRRRNRRRRGVWRVRRQRAQVVSRPARTRRRNHRDGFRRRVGADRLSDRQHDQERRDTRRRSSSLVWRRARSCSSWRGSSKRLTRRRHRRCARRQ